MPCLELFDQTDKKYQLETLGNEYSKRLFIEMNSTFGLHKYARYVYGINDFGKSAPAKDVIKDFGFTPEDVINLVINILKAGK